MEFKCWPQVWGIHDINRAIGVIGLSPDGARMSKVLRRKEKGERYLLNKTDRALDEKQNSNLLTIHFLGFSPAWSRRKETLWDQWYGERVSNHTRRRRKYGTYGALFGVALQKDKKWISTVHRRRARFTWKGSVEGPLLHHVQWVQWAVPQPEKPRHSQGPRIGELKRWECWYWGSERLNIKPQLQIPFALLVLVLPFPSVQSLFRSLWTSLPQSSDSFTFDPAFSIFSRRSFQMKPRAVSRRSPRRSRSEVWAVTQGKSFRKTVAELEVLSIIPAAKAGKGQGLGVLKHTEDAAGLPRDARGPWPGSRGAWLGEWVTQPAPFSPTGWLGNPDTLRVSMEWQQVSV